MPKNKIKVMRSILVLAAGVLVLPMAASQQQPDLNLMPMPSNVQLGTGQLSIDRFFTVAVTGSEDASLRRGVQRFIIELSKETGIPLKKESANSTTPTLLVRADHRREEVQGLGEDESYELAVTNTTAKLTAPNTLGILHGLQTFLQLVKATKTGFAIPTVAIRDQPRFPWRGLLIDPARHFIPIAVLKRNLDGMEAVKMNVLHLHLSDNEGFRVESSRFPKLHQMGSDGLYYTRAQVRELVAYAHDRGIRVVPEFEMPGHSGSWYVGYPALASGPGPYKLQSNGMEPVMDVTREGTYKFLDKLIEEMASLFPDLYFHIGGDEVNGQQWDANPHIQAFIRSHGIKNNQDLQAYFNRRLQKVLAKYHKRMIGWDEVLQPSLPKTIVVQTWRGQQSLAISARQGYRGLLSFGYYLDLMWPAARHYAVDPMSDAAASLNPEEKRRVLGGEACMWGEWVTEENIDSRIWPRNAAIAERLWSPEGVQDVTSMYRRIGELSWRLEWLGLTHKSYRMPMLYRMAATDDIGALATLADVVEPVKDYARINNLKGPMDFTAPLNRLVDAAGPESDQARRFQNLVRAYIETNYEDKTAEQELRTLLATWRDNDARLHRLLEASFLLNEIKPLSEDLAALGAAGLAALDCLHQSGGCPESWKIEQLAKIEQVKTPKADLLLMVAGSVQQLVEASAGQAPSGHL